MLRKYANVIVGLTTYYNEYLGISIQGLARLGRDFILVIHNDNPDTKITRREIRKMGYNGRVCIINSKCNIGPFQARLEILKYVQEHKILSKWFVFVDDDDILTDIQIPNVEKDKFAIIQNAIIVKYRLVDVLRAMKNPSGLGADDKNTYLVRPHVGLRGTLVRTDAMMRLGNILREHIARIIDIEESVKYRIPADTIMWNALNLIIQHCDKVAQAIYMDATNYIKINIDGTNAKYGIKDMPDKQLSQYIDKCNRAILDMIDATKVAEADE